MIRRPTPLLRRIRTRASLGLALLVLSGAIVSAAGAAGPVISFTLTGTQGDNGWYRSNVGIAWVVNDGSAVSGCVSTTLLSDTPGSAQGCSATDGTITNSSSVTIKIDRTAPLVTAAAAQRPPDANGWYNRPVSFSFSGTDSGSGIAGCSQATYGGPDNGAAAVAGSCRDNAGNQGSNAFGLSYDATLPTSCAGARRARLTRWSSGA
jgi:hypothetical protein